MMKRTMHAGLTIDGLRLFVNASHQTQYPQTSKQGWNPKSDMDFKSPEFSARFGIWKKIFLQFLLTAPNSRVFYYGIKYNLV